MSTFKDCLGREWSLSLTVGKLKPLAAMGLNIGKLAEAGESLGTVLFGDPEKVLVPAAWILASVDEAKCSPESFADGFDGPTLEAAGEAILNAVIDFSPRSALAARIKGRVKAALQEMDGKILAAMDAAEASSGSVGNSPGSSASTPAPSA